MTMWGRIYNKKCRTCNGNIVETTEGPKCVMCGRLAIRIAPDKDKLDFERRMDRWAYPNRRKPPEK